MIPEDRLDLLEGAVVVALSTLMPDNQPQTTPVWCSFDGTHIWVNTAKGRQKDLNMRERKQVTVMAMDPTNPYRYLEVRGVVDEITEDGALNHINALAKQYFRRDDFYQTMPDLRDRETRVIFKIKPVHVTP
jgi:PPOX class probable F420-dependent enzyme